jgi:hypothetical protein
MDLSVYCLLTYKFCQNVHISYNNCIKTRFVVLHLFLCLPKLRVGIFKFGGTCFCVCVFVTRQVWCVSLFGWEAGRVQMKYVKAWCLWFWGISRGRLLNTPSILYLKYRDTRLRRSVPQPLFYFLMFNYYLPFFLNRSSSI